MNLVIGERNKHASPSIEPFADTDRVFGSDHVGCAAGLEIVERGPSLAPDREQVPEALGRQQHRSGAAAFEQCVRGDGASVHDALRDDVGQARKNRL